MRDAMSRAVVDCFEWARSMPRSLPFTLSRVVFERSSSPSSTSESVVGPGSGEGGDLDMPCPSFVYLETACGTKAKPGVAVYQQIAPVRGV